MAPYEQLESLEQLRALHYCHEIRIADACETVPGGVDTLSDLEAVIAIMADRLATSWKVCHFVTSIR